MFIFPPDDMPTEAEIYEAEQECDFGYIEEITSGLPLEIVSVGGDDEIAPSDYFQWVVPIEGDTSVKGEPVETPIQALRDYFDWTTKWMRQEFT